ncbi:MAG: glycosyltransferase family protein [Magnetococcales bacterium]|nr:glycosyltransferase family protein [Magnetococcales bacterium]
MSDTPPTELHAAMADVATCIDQGLWNAALERLLVLKKRYPGYAHVLHLLGVVRQELGEGRGALEALSQAVAILPDNAVFQLDLGVLLHKRGARLPALDCLREAVRLSPDNEAACFHLGDLLMDLGEVEEAIDCFTRATRLKPDMAGAWINLGLCQKSRNRPELALECFRTASQVRPDHAQAHVNLAMAHLMMEHYPEGWREYEWRFKLDQPSVPYPCPSIPRWQGEPLQDRTILLLGEQGFGDMIQFIRFAAVLKDQGARVLLTVPTPLVTLFRRAPGVAQVQNHAEFREPVHFQIPLLSVPGVLGTTVETIPAVGGYLTPDPQQVAEWAGRLSEPGFKVGLVWEGKPLHANDPLRRRSCTLADLLPLAQVPGVSLYSLQKSEPDRPLPRIPEGLSMRIMDSYLTDFAATAAIMSRMDRIITIDSATAHLAGALGVPVWTLLPRAPDWRWGMNRSTTPWYASMTLFRQRVTDRWSEPVEAMVRAWEPRT